MNPALQIAITLDKHLREPSHIIVFGSAALILDPQHEARLLGRITNDIDVILPREEELQITADLQFWEALEATNTELESSGLYLTHIFPESEIILSKTWREYVVSMPRPELKHLKLSRPRVLDLILSKMGRGDAKDIEDILNALKLETISTKSIIAELETANIPPAYSDIFPKARDRILEAMRKR